MVLDVARERVAVRSPDGQLGTGLGELEGEGALRDDALLDRGIEEGVLFGK